MKKITLSLAFLISGLASAQVTIGSGTRSDTNSGLSTPISIYYNYSLTQQIYTAEEIGGAMSISQLKFYNVNTISSLNNTGNIDVWIGHTSQNSFLNVVSSTGAGWISVTNQSSVLTNGSLSFSGNEVIVTLDTPFQYNGTDNIVITFDENKPGNNGNSYKFYQTVDYAGDVSLINRSDSANPNPLDPPRNYTGPSSTATTEVQGKKYKAIVSIIGDRLGVDDFKTIGDAVLYPNPASDKVTLNTTLTINSIEVYDLNGKRLTASTALKSDNTLDISKLSSGVYLLKIVYKEGISSTKKLVKK